MPVHEPVGQRRESRVKSWRIDPVQRRQSCRHRDGIARKRACLVDGAERRDVLHDVAAPAERADRHAAADDLAERRQVRPDAVQLLCAALCATRKPVMTSSKISTAPWLRAFLAQRFEETRHRRNAVHVARDRFDDHAGDLGAQFAEKLAGPGRRRCTTASGCAPRVPAARRARSARRASACPDPALTSSESE